MCYNVIWIDDEWDTRGTSFIQTCKLRHQIYIKAFKTRKGGITALENNLKYWDAVILDAKAFNNSEDEVADLDGMYAARERLIELRQQRHIPFFVLTGQPGLMGDKSFEKAVGKFYDKKKPEDVNKLIADLKEEVSKSNRYQIKSIYHGAVEQLSEISIDACEDVIDILEAMHHPELPFTAKLHFNPLRQALEYIFRATNRVGIIPDDFFPSENVNLNQCFMFLKGNDADRIGIRYGEAGERVIPKHIENMMGLIISLGNVNSHSKLTDFEIQEAEKRITNEGMSSKYLVFSMALQLCEIASWMNRYIATHPYKEDNLKKCQQLHPVQSSVGDPGMTDFEKAELVGVVEYDDGIYHIGDKFYLNRKVIEQKGWLNKKVKIVEQDTNNISGIKEKYPFFACRIELVKE